MTTPQQSPIRPKDHSAQPRVISRFGEYTFKLADRTHEFEQIHRLLHKTFVLEVRQHEDPGTDYLIDKFHNKNHYVVAIHNERLRGMVALHDQPPFSVARALSDSGQLEQLCPKLLEARIMAIEPTERSKAVFPGLICSIHEYARQGGYQYIAMTGLRDRQRMYERMGFRALGAAVLKGEAYFVPMLLDFSNLPSRVIRDLDRWKRRLGLRT
jgi:N-acyl-L-homoserine lactone synthetase